VVQHIAARYCCLWNGWSVDPFPLCLAFSDSLDGRYSVEYYGSAVPPTALASYPPILAEAVAGSGVARLVISPSAVGTFPSPCDLRTGPGSISIEINGLIGSLPPKKTWEVVVRGIRDEVSLEFASFYPISHLFIGITSARYWTSLQSLTTTAG